MAIETHFFIESGGFPMQTGIESFGPKSPTNFRLTSSFILPPNITKKAFAICKGVVLVQPQTGAGNEEKVNLILRPYSQPFPGLNVKYFLYRGLQRSDFFTTDSAPKIIDSTTTTSDFIKKINEDFHAFHDGRKDDQGNAIPVPDFTAKFIGYDESQTDLSIPLSAFFFKESEFVEADETFEKKDDFELPLIAMGKSLGSFASGSCGIDVVLNYGDYSHEFDNSEFDFNLAYARASEAEINLSGSDFEQKLQREQSTQFIDIAAFYGLFAAEGKLKISDASGEVSSKSASAIYTEVLAPFWNKNKVYLYIQSNRHRSYNFYNNYSLSETNANDLKTGTVESLAETTYRTLNWPVHIFEGSQVNSNNFNDISIQLTASSSYEEIALYAALGNGDFNRGFISRENLIDPLNISQDVNFSKVISFKVPNIDSNGEKKNISSLIQIIYVGIELDFSLTDNYTIWSDKKRHSLYNNIFPNLTVTPVFKSNQNLLIAAVNKVSLISYKGFSNYMNESVLNGSVVFQLGKKDIVNTDSTIETLTKEKVLFVAKKVETLDDFAIHDTAVFAKEVVAKKMNIDFNLTDYSNYFKSVYSSTNYNLKHYLIDDMGESIKILSLDIGNQFDYCFYNLGITKEELNILKGIVPINSSNIDFYLKDNLDNPHINTVTKAPFFKYSLGVFFENNDGILSILMPSTPIYVYGFSHSFLTSKEYSDYEEKTINIQQYEEYNEINIA
ncbi:hypothetical protein [Flavobacterium daejeonense]|uniref:hypothetical protein n=1 Tax=Flavobacterium daejeonense TaxID=350893 RepID=UPI00047EBFB2|nr:hypothetical protein [Flavobacterium daejeonense]